MENNQSSKDFMQKSQKLSLLGYYQGLPERVAPKQQFLEEIQRRCEQATGKLVTMTTVRNWVLYGRRPNRHECVAVISELTGIKEVDLWQD